jgi:predicted nucleotidyltransferase
LYAIVYETYTVGGILLEELFSSQARVAILKLLLLNAGDRYYLREIASLTEQPVRAVQRELPRLERIGLVTQTADGNRKYYQVNRECPIFPELKAIFLKTVGLGDALREYLRKAKGNIRLAFIYGSYARGEESTTSDIDLLVVGNITVMEVASVLSLAKSELGREINPVVMTAGEFAGKLASGNHFVLSLLEEPKIFLVGNAEDLEAFAGRREADEPPPIGEGDARDKPPTEARQRALQMEEELVAELELLGIRYLSRQSSYQANGVRPPAALLADLVRQPSARVRAAVIAVLLAHPEYAEAVPEALEQLHPDDRLTLQSFYAAAMLLQQEHAHRLRAFLGARWRPLPDVPEAASQLNLPDVGTPAERLAWLGREHRRRSGTMVNWAGSYEQVAQRLMRRWEVERQWQP